MEKFTGAEASRDVIPPDAVEEPDDWVEEHPKDRRGLWKLILYGILVVALTFILLGFLRFWMVGSYGGI